MKRVTLGRVIAWIVIALLALTAINTLLYMWISAGS